MAVDPYQHLAGRDYPELADTSKAIVAWRVWAVDNRNRMRVYNSRQTLWAQVPKDGILVVLLYHSDGTRQIMAGEDWYFFDPTTGVWGANSNSEADNLARYPNAVFVRGKWTDAVTYKTASDQAMAAAEMP